MSVNFVDTHCHFDFPPFRGNEAHSLQLAAAVGVEKIIVPATGVGRFDGVLKLANRWPPLYAALGMHPVFINSHREDDDLAVLADLLHHRPAKLVAIGEIGLDLYIRQPQFERQLALLDAQLRLAHDYDLPVILHSRRTHDKLAQRLRRIAPARRGVIHGFAGSRVQADVFVALGYKIGVGGTITWPRASKTRETIARLPLSSLLLETDAPDMPLLGYQGQPNRPERLTEIWRILCELRPESPQQIAEAIRGNTRELFAL